MHLGTEEKLVEIPFIFPDETYNSTLQEALDPFELHYNQWQASLNMMDNICQKWEGLYEHMRHIPLSSKILPLSLQEELNKNLEELFLFTQMQHHILEVLQIQRRALEACEPPELHYDTLATLGKMGFDLEFIERRYTHIFSDKLKSCKEHAQMLEDLNQEVDKALTKMKQSLEPLAKYCLQNRRRTMIDKIKNPFSTTPYLDFYIKESKGKEIVEEKKCLCCES